MIIYLLVAILMITIGYNVYTSRFSTKISFPLVFGILSIFWGVAYIYAPDIPEYILYFKKQTYNWFDTGFKLPSSSFELGFNILSCMVKSLTEHYYIYQFFLFSSELLLVMIGLKKILKDKIALIMICAMFFVLPSNLLSALRQGIAISLFIFAVPYIYEHKFFKYCILIIFASFFHTSAIFLLLLYWLPLVKYIISAPKILLLYFLILNVCYFFNITISNALDSILLTLFDLYEKSAMYVRYTNVDLEETISNFGILKILEMDFIYVVFILINKDNSKTMLLLKSMFLIYCTLNMLLGGILAHRISYYFVILYHICLIYSLCIIGRHLLRDERNGYLLSCFYLIGLNLFYFQNPFSDAMEYKNMFLEHILYGIY